MFELFYATLTAMVVLTIVLRRTPLYWLPGAGAMILDVASLVWGSRVTGCFAGMAGFSVLPALTSLAVGAGCRSAVVERERAALRKGPELPRATVHGKMKP